MQDSVSTSNEEIRDAVAAALIASIGRLRPFVASTAR
jgi:hypothetical protein